MPARGHRRANNYKALTHRPKQHTDSHRQDTGKSVDDRTNKRKMAVRILDVRSASDFHAEHLIGASNIPLDELQHRTGELPPATETFGEGAGLMLVVSAQHVDEALGILTPGWNVVEVREATPELFCAERERGKSVSGGPSGGALL